jgi:hypothetical protein
MSDTPRDPQRPTRQTLWMLALAGFALGAVVAGAVVWAIWPDDQGDEPAHTIEVGVHRELPDQTASYEDGATCAISTDPSRQVVVLDDNGAIIGQVWPANGTLRTGENGKWYCSAYDSIDVPGSPLYAFSVNGQPSLVASREEIEAAGWSVTLGWVEDDAPPVATPRSLPVRQ